MNNSKDTKPQSEPPNWPSKKLPLILIGGMVLYGTVFLVLSSGHFTPTQVWFWVQLLNALGFFLGLAAFVRTFNKK